MLLDHGLHSVLCECSNSTAGAPSLQQTLTPEMSAPWTFPKDFPAFWKTMVGCAGTASAAVTRLHKSRGRAHDGRNAMGLRGLRHPFVVDINLEEGSLQSTCGTDFLL